MKKVLLIAATTGYQIRSFGEAAERLGIRLVFASDRCDQLDDPWCDEAIPVRFHQVERSLQAIAEVFGGRAPAGILAVGDRPTILAAHVAAHFGLPGNTPESSNASANKLATRQALQAAGLPTPAFRSVPLESDPAALAGQVTYPAVLKPLALSGSRGVIRVNDAREFVAAFGRIVRLLQSTDVRIQHDPAHDGILVESFIEGCEFALEGVLSRGVLQPLAIFDKPDPLEGPFFEETIYLTPSRESETQQRRLEETVAAAARALKLQHGPVHAECRMDGKDVYVLEVAARPIGGLCSRALRFESADGSSASLEELLLRHAVGEDVSGYHRENGASGVMMIPIPRRGIYRGVEGVGDAAAVSGIEDVRITTKPDTLLVPLPEGRSYLGFVFARAHAPAEVEQALRTAHTRLQFSIEKEISVI